MAHAAEDSVLVRTLGQFREMLGDANTWDVGRDFLELAAMGVWRVRLHVKRVHVTWSTSQTHVNCRIGPSFGGRIDVGQAKVVGQSKPCAAQCPDFEKVAPLDSVTKKMWCHGRCRLVVH